ncbi:hypothetical protein OKW50_000091 [Paraburkholderia youngii]
MPIRRLYQEQRVNIEPVSMRTAEGKHERRPRP